MQTVPEGRARHVGWSPRRLFGLNRQTFGSARQKRSSRSSSLWTVLIFAVAMMTTLNVFISFKLTHYVDSTDRGSDRLTNDTRHVDCDGGDASKSALNQLAELIASPSRTINGGFRFVNGTGRYDNTRKYRIHDFVLVAEEWANLGAPQRLVCLATQMSVDRLHWFAEVCRQWQGPVSAAVFVPGEDFHVAIQYVSYLRHCFPDVRAFATFHFLYPSQRSPVAVAPSSVIDEAASLNLSCDTSESAALKKLAKHYPRAFQQWRRPLLYPQNHLRNVARKGCPTPYVFLIDVDVVPRPGLGPALDQFLAYPLCDHCAFVVPTYEVDETVSMPHNKSVLLQLVKDKRAQPFHKAVFINNQFATNVSQWEKMPEGLDVSVAYAVTNFELFYEPFYVAQDDVPPHDERFLGYGFTRNTQVYEMFVANFKFLVLNYAFAVHRGLKRRKTKNSWREKQNRANSRLFKKFEREVLARHGYTAKS